MKLWKAVTMNQGSPAWHGWRRNGIGASEARYLIGWNTGLPSELLFKIKTEEDRPFRGNARTRQGQELEPIARSAFEQRVQRRYEPVCIEHVEQPWLRSSLDGLSSCGRFALEIKCGPVALAKAAAGEISHDYCAQLQYILAITGFPEIDFWCYMPDDQPVCITIPRDQDHIDRLVENAAVMWARIARFRGH
jgi:putative phage-type endonuclease